MLKTNREVAQHLLRFPDDKFDVFVMDWNSDPLCGQDLDFLTAEEALERVRRQWKLTPEEEDECEWIQIIKHNPHVLCGDAWRWR